MINRSCDEQVAHCVELCAHLRRTTIGKSGRPAPILPHSRGGDDRRRVAAKLAHGDTRMPGQPAPLCGGALSVLLSSLLQSARHHTAAPPPTSTTSSSALCSTVRTVSARRLVTRSPSRRWWWRHHRQDSTWAHVSASAPNAPPLCLLKALMAVIRRDQRDDAAEPPEPRAGQAHRPPGQTRQPPGQRGTAVDRARAVGIYDTSSTSRDPQHRVFTGEFDLATTVILSSSERSAGLSPTMPSIGNFLRSRPGFNSDSSF